MSQVFSGDSVNSPAAVPLPTSGETTAVTGNFLNPPFQNAKAVVFGQVTIGPGTGTTSIILRIRRNPNAENVIVAGNAGVAVTGGVNLQIALNAADAIPDGRPVQYAITVTPGAATGVGNIPQANISAFLISG